MSRIVATRKGQNGSFEMFKLDSGEVLNYSQTVEAVKSGKILGCNIGKDIYGYDTIKSNRNDCDSDNLSMLPEF